MYETVKEGQIRRSWHRAEQAMAVSLFFGTLAVGLLTVCIVGGVTALVTREPTVVPLWLGLLALACMVLAILASVLHAWWDRQTDRLVEDYRAGAPSAQ
jgi:O-antigen/teichoic acid export membrane protein